MYEKHIELLERAKTYLWDGVGSLPDDRNSYETEYICHAICRAADDTDDFYPSTHWEVGTEVKAKISGYGVYTSYLRYMSTAFGWKRPEDMSSQEIQSMRLALIDTIIAEYKEKEVQYEQS